jgi:hypothetical protein
MSGIFISEMSYYTVNIFNFELLLPFTQREVCLLDTFDWYYVAHYFRYAACQVKGKLCFITSSVL